MASVTAALAAFGRDLRHAARSLLRSPGFALATTLTLGLGIGANAAMFGIVDRLMFRAHRLEVCEPAMVSSASTCAPPIAGTRALHAATEQEVHAVPDLRKWTSSFSQYSAFAQR